MTPLRVDLNADVGGSYGRWTLGDDGALLPYITSANICCGYHAGDPHVMRHTAALAVQYGAGIGAHVGLPDLMGYAVGWLSPQRNFATTLSTRWERYGLSPDQWADGCST